MHTMCMIVMMHFDILEKNAGTNNIQLNVHFQKGIVLIENMPLETICKCWHSSVLKVLYLFLQWRLRVWVIKSTEDSDL